MFSVLLLLGHARVLRESPEDPAAQLAQLTRRWADPPFGTFAGVKYLAGGSRDVFLARPTGALSFATMGPQPRNASSMGAAQPVVLKFLHAGVSEAAAQKGCDAVNLAPDHVAATWPEGFGKPGTSPAGHFSRCYGYRYHDEGTVLVLEAVPGENIVVLMMQNHATRALWREIAVQFLDIVAALHDADVWFPGVELHPPQFVVDPAEKVLRLVDTDNCELAPERVAANLPSQINQWVFYLVAAPCCPVDVGLQECSSSVDRVNSKLWRGAKATVHDIDGVLAGMSACDGSILARRVAPSGPSILATLIHEASYAVSRGKLAGWRRTAAELFS